MSTAKSSYDNCLWSTTGHTDGQQYQVINNHINDMDYYLFGDNDISTSELVERVLSKTFLDINFVSAVQTQFNSIHSNNGVDNYLIDSIHPLDVTVPRSIDIDMNDPVIVSDILFASIPFDGDDNDYESVGYDYSDSYESDSNFTEDTMMDLMDGVVYDNHCGFLWENLDHDDSH